MKKLLIITALTLCVIPLMAQTLNFMGHPLGCDFATFKSYMKQHKIKYKGKKSDTMYRFVGKFGGDDAEIFAFETPISKRIFGVIVSLDDYMSNYMEPYTLEIQKDKFNDLERQYILKYGAPEKSEYYDTTWKIGDDSISLLINKPDSQGRKYLNIIYTENGFSKEWLIFHDSPSSDY